MIGKSFFIWFTFIPLAILNGVLREEFLILLLGNFYALFVSGTLLCGMIFIVTFLLLPYLGKASKQIYILMGILWLIATVGFESFLGLLQGQSLEQILSAYDITTGNIWLLVVIFIGIVPYLVAKKRELFIPSTI